jgi:hypothetical protein
MSLLLDALNKADQERKRNEATPGINSNHENFSDLGSRNKSISFIGLANVPLRPQPPQTLLQYHRYNRNNSTQQLSINLRRQL